MKILIEQRLFRTDDLLELEDMGEEELNEVFNIIAKTIILYPKGKRYFDKCKFVAKNKSLYDDALKKYDIK